MTVRNGNLYCMDVSSIVSKYRGMLGAVERRRGRRKGGNCFDWLLRRKKCFGWLCRRKGGKCFDWLLRRKGGNGSFSAVLEEQRLK